MTITRLRLLQLGDVHFPEAKNSPAAIDRKDVGFPEILTERLGLSPFHAVIRKLQEILEQEEIAAIAIMGDLTTKGDKAEFRACLQFLESALWRRPGISFPVTNVLLVPGNHDINRDDAKLDPVDKKFEYLNDALLSLSLKPVGVDFGTVADISTGNVVLKIFGMNTCVGCGTLRSFPERIKDKVQKIYDDAIASAKDLAAVSAVLDDLYEQLDTPLVTDNAINWILKEIATSGATSIICGHHNLLPQVMPRIAPYTELINGGHLRSALLRTQRKILYLHGHTHTDPVEVVGAPSDPTSVLATVGAPLLSDGFNVLEFEFAEDGSPLGCVVHQYRYQNGLVSVQKEVPIPLNSGDQLASSDNHLKVLSAFTKNRIYYWRELVSHTRLTSDVLKPLVSELMWKGQLNLDRKNSDNPEKWVITRPW